MAASLTATAITTKVTSRIRELVLNKKNSTIRAKDTLLVGAVILTTTVAVKPERDLTSDMGSVKIAAIMLKKLMSRGVSCITTTAMVDNRVIPNKAVDMQGKTTYLA